MKIRILFGLVLLIAAAMLRAQDPPPPAPLPPPGGDVFFYHSTHGPFGRRGSVMMGDFWKNSEIAQQLQITDAQRQQLSQVFVDHRLRLIDDQAALEKEQLKLQTLMDRDQPPQNEVMAQVDQVQAARGKLEKEFTGLTLDFRRILSPDQWRKLQSIRDQRHTMFIKKFDGPAPPPLPPSDGPKP